MLEEIGLLEAGETLTHLAQAFLAGDPAKLPGSALILERTRERKPGGGPDLEAKYKALAEQIPAVIFVAPLDTDRLSEAYVSPQIETILGFTQEEWLADPLLWYQRVHAEDKNRWSVEAASLFLSGTPLRSVYRVLARDGRVVWFQCEAKMVRREDGRPWFIHGIGFDVTDLKEAENSLKAAHDEMESRVVERTRELAQTNAELELEIVERRKTEAKLVTAKETAEAASRAKGEFVANMSHEIRTPMNGVLGMLELCQHTVLSPEQQEYVSVAKTSAESLLNIINDILDFSKIESGKLALDPVDFDVRGIVEGILKTIAHRAHEKNLEVMCRIAPEIPDMLRGDPGRLRQVLVNLLGNAIKFTERGEVTLEARLVGESGKLKSNGRQTCVLEFSVADTGIGIAAENTRSIFEPFTQADGSMTRGYGGTGLGLSISTQLAGLMGGRMWADSEPGRGSTFFFTAHFEVPVNRARDRNSFHNRFRGLRALVVDDNSKSRWLLRVMLEDWKIQAVCAAGAQEALSEIQCAQNGGKSFDLVVLDSEMPGMDGFELARRIDADSPRIMMVPPVGWRASATSAAQLGIAAYVAKPILASELLAAIAHATGLEQDDQDMARAAAVGRDWRPGPGDPTGERRLRILLAEDNPVNQRVTLRLLEKHGHTVVVANNGREALEACRASTFDAVLMDVQMPVMDGLETAARIRAFEAAQGMEQRMPIIALTAHAMHSDMDRCLQAGMDLYLSKPYRAQDLLSAIEDAVKSAPRRLDGAGSRGR